MLAELTGAFLLLALPIRILLDSKKRLGKVRWTWAIMMSLLYATFIAAWIDLLYPWIVTNFFASDDSVIPHASLIAHVVKFLVIFWAFQAAFDIYRRLNREAMATGSESSLERFGGLVALVGMAMSILYYAYGEMQLLPGCIMIAGAGLFLAGVIRQRTRASLKGK